MPDRPRRDIFPCANYCQVRVKAGTKRIVVTGNIVDPRLVTAGKNVRPILISRHARAYVTMSLSAPSPSPISRLSSISICSLYPLSLPRHEIIAESNALRRNAFDNDRARLSRGELRFVIHGEREREREEVFRVSTPPSNFPLIQPRRSESPPVFSSSLPKRSNWFFDSRRLDTRLIPPSFPARDFRITKVEQNLRPPYPLSSSSSTRVDLN